MTWTWQYYSYVFIEFLQLNGFSGLLSIYRGWLAETDQEDKLWTLHIYQRIPRPAIRIFGEYSSASRASIAFSSLPKCVLGWFLVVDSEMILTSTSHQSATIEINAWSCWTLGFDKNKGDQNGSFYWKPYLRITVFEKEKSLNFSEFKFFILKERKQGVWSVQSHSYVLAEPELGSPICTPTVPPTLHDLCGLSFCNNLLLKKVTTITDNIGNCLLC